MKIVLFFTSGVSIEQWHNCGMLERELRIYLSLLEKGASVSFITYGTNSNEISLLSGKRIKVFFNKYKLPAFLYSRLLPILHFNILRKSDIFKTNQIDGGLVAARCARIFKKPLIARMGYLWSDFMSRTYGNDSSEYEYSVAIEKKVFLASRVIVVTAEHMKDQILLKNIDYSGKIRVIPNYVDSDSFSPRHVSNKIYDIVFIGRLENQKNIFSLLEAVKAGNLKILVIGDGSLGPTLRNEFVDIANNITWCGISPHENLPDLMSKAKLFVLPSFYEGHPKTVLEAMSCAMPVLVARSPGLEGLLEEGVEGWYCDTDSESILKSIVRILSDPEKMRTTGLNARKRVLGSVSLPTVSAQELELYMQISKRSVQ